MTAQEHLADHSPQCNTSISSAAPQSAISNFTSRIALWCLWWWWYLSSFSIAERIFYSTSAIPISGLPPSPLQVLGSHCCSHHGAIFTSKNSSNTVQNLNRGKDFGILSFGKSVEEWSWTPDTVSRSSIHEGLNVSSLIQLADCSSTKFHLARPCGRRLLESRKLAAQFDSRSSSPPGATRRYRPLQQFLPSRERRNRRL